MLKSFFKLDFFVILVLFLINLALHLYSLGKIVYPIVDEGVYLYSAKLIAEGLIPYKDFFLAHPLWLLLPVSFIFTITNFDLNIFHIIYTTWSFSLVFPLYFISLKLTKSRFAAILSIILLSTFTEFVIADTRFFAFRQASQPLLAWSLYLIFVKRLKWAGIILGIFAITLIQNLFLSICFIFSLIVYRHKNMGSLCLLFFLIILMGYLIILIIPGALSNIIIYQMERPFVPYQTRLDSLINTTLPNSFPIILTGLGGSVVALFLKKPVGLFNILGLFSTVFISSSYYPHYMTILSSGLTISAAILISFFNRNFLSRVTLTLIIISLIYVSSFSNLKYHLIDNKTPQFFKAVEVLKTAPSPLFSFEPIYALYAKKDLTFHYHVADMRSLAVLNKSLTDEEYFNVLNMSNTVLLEPFALSRIHPNVLKYINSNFRIVYEDSMHTVLIKNNLDAL